MTQILIEDPFNFPKKKQIVENLDIFGKISRLISYLYYGPQY